MSETNAKTIEQLTAEMHLLRAAVAELAVVQAEALNAVAKHLTENNPSPLAAHMLGKPASAWTAGRDALDAAKRSLEIASRLSLL